MDHNRFEVSVVRSFWCTILSGPNAFVLNYRLIFEEDRNGYALFIHSSIVEMILDQDLQLFPFIAAFTDKLNTTHILSLPHRLLSCLRSPSRVVCIASFFLL